MAALSHTNLYLLSSSAQWRLVSATTDDYAALVRRCRDDGVLEAGKWVHDDIIRSGHGQDRYLCNLLIEMYGKCGNLQDALAVFNSMGHFKNVFSWTMIISAYAKLDGNHRNAVQLFQGMLLEGMKPPDSFVYTILLGACANSGWAGLADGKVIHSYICQVGILHGDVLAETALVNMYGKCGSTQDAELVFRGMQFRNLVSWNAMMVAFADNGLGREALNLFHEMQLQGVKPDSVTFLGLIGACSALREVAGGKAIHMILVASGIYRCDDVVVGTALVNMYGKCGSLDNARRVFDRMHLRNVVSWNAMISAYAQQVDLREEASHLFWEMEVEGMEPDEITFMSLLCSCSTIAEGKVLQERIIACGFGSDLGVANTLLNMYGKLGHLDEAREVFDLMQMKDVISWNTMIAAYAQNGHCEQALRIYATMQLESTRPNSITFVNALGACRNLAEGKQVHNHIVGSMLESNTIVRTALVNMYGNCGSLVEARNAFQRLDHRNVVTWTAMIVACAQHQHVDNVVELYRAMNLEGLKPNEITFLGILFACGHAGLLSESLHYFHCMIREHGIDPIPDHYACMGDLLGRTGCLDHVEDLIQNNITDGLGWTSLLDACRIHGDPERGKRAAQSALELDVRNGATYVLLSNIYAATR